MLRRFHPLPILLLLLGFAAAAVALTLRYRAEAASRVVSLVLDYSQLRGLSAASGTPVEQAFHDFKAAGITGMAVTEETLAELQDAGLLQVRVSGGQGGRAYRLEIDDPEVRERVFDYVTHLAPGATEQPVAGDHLVLDGPGGGTAYVPGRFEDLRSLPVGLSAPEVAQVKKAGLEPVGRILNPASLTSDSLRWVLQRLKDQGITTVIFGGEEVLGYRGLIKETAQAFRDLNLLYGSVEFGKQRGDEALSRLMMDRTVRVHSISSAEMNRLPENEAIERYIRAPAERNIRVNYVRLPGVVTTQTYPDSIAYTRKLARLVVHEGFGLRGQPVAIREVWASDASRALALALMGLGIGAAAVLLLAGVVPLARGLQAGLAVLVGLLCAGLAGSGIGPGLQLVALLAAVVFPTLAFVLFPQPIGAFEDHEHALVRVRGVAVVAAVYEFLAISTVTLVGALMVAGLLSDLPYMIKVKSFAGIKVATVLPLLLVGWVYLTGMSGEYPSWDAERDAVTRRLQAFFSEPVRIWHTIAVGVGLVAVALLVMRSGNDPGVGVSDLELRFRAILDRVLGVRPRTKEFLLGHPALWLALAMGVSPRWRKWALPVLLIGAIGQTGMLNSFCHLHSPLKLTLIRTFHGLWIGSAIGILLVLVWTRWIAGERGLAKPRPR